MSVSSPSFDHSGHVAQKPAPLDFLSRCGLEFLLTLDDQKDPNFQVIRGLGLRVLTHQMTNNVLSTLEVLKLTGPSNCKQEWNEVSRLCLADDLSYRISNLSEWNDALAVL